MTDPKPIHEALADVMADVEGVAKRDTNEHQRFSFRGIDAILNAVGPVLRRHRVAVLPHVEEVREEVVEVGQKRSRMGHVTVLVTYTFVGPDGSTMACRVPGEAMDSGDKAVAKAMSVAFRTALIQALALPTDEPDPDSQSHQRSAAPALMTESQREAIAERLSGLDDEARDLLSSWWRAQGFPPLASGRLTQEEATLVLVHLSPDDAASAGTGEG